MKYSTANTKLKKLYKLADTTLAQWLNRKVGRSKAKVYSFDLLSGVDCPFAHECRSRAVVNDNGSRSIQDGPFTKFRCFSASQEVLFTNTFNSRKRNHDDIHALPNCNAMADALLDALPADAGVVRIHVSGDFFNAEYFKAWMIVASCRPDVLFYAYTKSLQYWVAHRGMVPSNMVLTASRGGRDDDMIEQHGLRSAKVVFSVAEAEALGLEIDNDDSHASNPAIRDNDFALLIHGVQPAGSEAANALKILKQSEVAA
jgi:hypothetical protein